MQISSPSSPVTASKETRPDWKIWLEEVVQAKMYEVWAPDPNAERYRIETTKEVSPESKNISFCGCCGAIWVTPAGMRKLTGRALSEEYAGRGNGLNREGIYFGENHSAAELVAVSELENAVTFEFEDGGITHSFAWKDV